MKNLPQLLLAHPGLTNSANPDYPKALKDSVLKVDEHLRRKLNRDATYAGTTMVLVLAVGNVMLSHLHPSV